MTLEEVIKLEMPKFNSFEEERQHRKQHLAAAFRIFAKYGFDDGFVGHISCRDPEFPDRFWLNPLATHFSQIKTSDLILVSHEGELLSPNKGKKSLINRTAVLVHAEIHEARPDVVAACHCHTVYGRAFSSLGRRLDPITQDACVFYNDHTVFDDFSGVVVEKSEGVRISQALGPRKAIILQNHGLMTVGHSVDEAAWWFIALERACQAQLLADSACAGRAKDETPIKINEKLASQTHDFLGTPFYGWLNFQPLYDMVIAEQPDLLK
ncbi:9323_t:CDS:2 [Ambispora gerdemannii]|uniref:9323_t:CDS:1 n=1 Tax=Ambispora gerdemannii TaxID=144530 RepID=A0A9N9E9U0_9GLOM|nr:9323_t:CDS:2 [Ambispora gerdemannii]